MGVQYKDFFSHRSIYFHISFFSLVSLAFWTNFIFEKEPLPSLSWWHTDSPLLSDSINFRCKINAFAMIYNWFKVSDWNETRENVIIYSCVFHFDLKQMAFDRNFCSIRFKWNTREWNHLVMDNSIRKGYHTPLIRPWLSASDVVIHIDDTQPLIGIAAHITLEREFFSFLFWKFTID